MRDTSKQTEERYREMLLSLTPLERLRMASRMYDSGRKLVIAGMQNEEHELDPSQLKWQLFLRMYGSDFTASEIMRIKPRVRSRTYHRKRTAELQINCLLQQLPLEGDSHKRVKSFI